MKLKFGDEHSVIHKSAMHGEGITSTKLICMLQGYAEAEIPYGKEDEEVEDDADDEKEIKDVCGFGEGVSVKCKH